MIVKSFEVLGLFGREKKFSLRFHDDLNILTGFNGSGKTTVMKLIWYMMSGSIHEALKEIPFRKCTLQTDAYRLQVTKVSVHTCEAIVEDANGKREFQDRFVDDEDIDIDARDEVKEYTEVLGSSVFFPTFRRIEGGFSVEDEAYRASRNVLAPWNTTTKLNDLQEAVAAVSRRMSNGAHKFVTSIATSE